MNCPCKGCTKRWVSETSRCHASCEEYKEWTEFNRQLKELKTKHKERFNSIGNVLFSNLRKR